MTQPYADGAWSFWDKFGPGYQLLQRLAGRRWLAGDWLSRTAGWQTRHSSPPANVVTGVHVWALHEA
jgi:hypothetical protein